MLEELGGIGMFLSCVHVTSRTHSALDALESGEKRAIPCKRFEQRTGCIAHDLCQLHQASLLILPGKEDNEPVLEQHSNEFGIQLTEDTPGIGGAPLINLPVLRATSL